MGCEGCEGGGECAPEDRDIWQPLLGRLCPPPKDVVRGIGVVHEANDVVGHEQKLEMTSEAKSVTTNVHLGQVEPPL